ncbi:MAG: hypothetical protein ACI9R8_002716 [Candidatus Paceibacteria bacterium]|jgi:hypothetical protein
MAVLIFYLSFTYLLQSLVFVDGCPYPNLRSLLMAVPIPPDGCPYLSLSLPVDPYPHPPSNHLPAISPSLIFGPARIWYSRRHY